MKMPEKHVFICTNERTPTGPKQSCGMAGGHDIRIALKKELARRGMLSQVRSSKSGCLGTCEMGPTMVIYPHGVWYKMVKVEYIPEIVEKTIIRNQIIDRLIFKQQDWITCRGETPQNVTDDDKGAGQ